MTARLKLVAEAPIDITALNRADVGDAERWAKCHVEGDRRAPVWLPDRVKRGWLR